MKNAKILILSVMVSFSLISCGCSAESNITDSTAAPYTAGDIVLADGSVIPAKDFTDLDSSNLPAAVIAGQTDDGTFLGVGVHRSDTPLQWEAEGTPDSPAFHFADTYAAVYGLTGEYSSGWHMPSIAELTLIYENSSTINASLQSIYKQNNLAAMNGLGTNWYWASTPSDTDDDYAWFIHFFNGYGDCCPKNFTNLHVLAVRGF